jgi:hypothetical protein
LERQSQQALATQCVGLASADETIHILSARVKELEQEGGSHYKPSSPHDDLLSEPECPEGFEENAGQVPDFFIKEDGVNLQARYVRRLPGTGLVQGSLGGPRDTMHLHELHALPSLVFEHTPDAIPNWFINSIAANSPVFGEVMAEANRLGDWGIQADLERYHNLDTQIHQVQADLRILQEEESTLAIKRCTCRYRLARSDVGERLASLEALSPLHQDGQIETIIRSRARHSRGRPFVK